MDEDEKPAYSERYILFTDGIGALILLAIAWYFDLWSYCVQFTDWLFS